MNLKQITYEEARLAFFREQLAHAERVLKWWAANSENWVSVEDKADAVSFYADIVKMLMEG